MGCKGRRSSDRAALASRVRILLLVSFSHRILIVRGGAARTRGIGLGFELARLGLSREAYWKILLCVCVCVCVYWVVLGRSECILACLNVLTLTDSETDCRLNLLTDSETDP